MGGILRAGDHSPATEEQTFDGQLGIHDGHDDTTVLGVEAAIDDQLVSVEDAGTGRAGGRGAPRHRRARGRRSRVGWEKEVDDFRHAHKCPLSEVGQVRTEEGVHVQRVQRQFYESLSCLQLLLDGRGGPAR